jgi:hypothetical protein
MEHFNGILFQKSGQLHNCIEYIIFYAVLIK